MNKKNYVIPDNTTVLISTQNTVRSFKTIGELRFTKRNTDPKANYYAEDYVFDYMGGLLFVRRELLTVL